MARTAEVVRTQPDASAGVAQLRDGAPPRWRTYRVPLAVLLLGLAVTAALTAPAEVSYRHNERRLLKLQTNLTASVLGTAPQQTEATLGRVVGLAAESGDPAATFKAAIAPSMTPKGPYATATLILLANDGGVSVLSYVGAPPVRNVTAPVSVALYRQTAATTSLVTSRVVGTDVQKIGYLLSAKGAGGTFVIAAAQQLPLRDRITVPRTSPDANLDFAIYFGTKPAAGDLILTTRTAPHGTTAMATVPFANNSLTFVASARGSLAGAWAEYLPWGIAVIGVVISLWAAWEVRRLLARRTTAEALAAVNRDLYQRQRAVSEQLQRSLLPRSIPAIARMDIAARYVPSTGEAEVGGDWYSVMPVDDDMFAFVVGDVSGHGIPAAGTMAALRYTARTLAKLGYAPNEILDRANGEIDIVADEAFATVLVGVVSTEPGEVTLASAGHPPPYVRGPGRSGFIELTTGPPLGIAIDPVKATTIAFPAGSTLVAYTDGLVERRGEHIGDRLERLAEAASYPAPSAEDLLDHILTTLVPGEHEDDIAILVIKAQDTTE